MDNREFKNSLLKEKIKRFRAAVAEAADRLGVKQPAVRIWECPYGTYNPDEIAHCHHDRGMICISERMLERRDFDDLVETATHEVSHLLHPDHGHEFHRTHQSLKEAAWRPPAGVGITSFSEADLQKIKPSKYKPSRPDKKRCNHYHVSDHAKGRLEKCEWCNGYFCKNHIVARQAGIIKLGNPNAVEKDDPHTHPCMSYSDSKKRRVPIIGASNGGCNYCGAHMQGLPHDCKFCKELFCDEHRLPEDHECAMLEIRKRGTLHQTTSRGSPSRDNKENLEEEDEENYDVSHLTRRHLTTDSKGKNHKNYNKPSSSKKFYAEEDSYKEMYRPSKGGFNFNFKNPFRNLLSFGLSYEIKNALTQFCIALLIGLGLNYVYYQNLSLHYLFIGGVQDWFVALTGLFNYGVGRGYDLFYIAINGLFYYYLFSTTVKLAYATITRLNKKGTITFLIGVAILMLVIFKYFPNIIY